MSTDLHNLTHLREKVDQLRREVDRAEGVHENNLKRLKKEFGCKSFEEAISLLSRLKGEKDKSERELGKAVRRFEKKWSKELESLR